MGVAQGLEHSTLDLSAGCHWIDGHTTVDGHDHVPDGDLTGLDVHLDFHEGGSERRGAVRRHVGTGAHDLLLLVEVERVQGDLFEADGPAVRSVGASIT